MTAREPERRPQTAIDLIQSIDGARAGRMVFENVLGQPGAPPFGGQEDAPLLDDRLRTEITGISLAPALLQHKPTRESLYKQVGIAVALAAGIVLLSYSAYYAVSRPVVDGSTKEAGWFDLFRGGGLQDSQHSKGFRWVGYLMRETWRPSDVVEAAQHTNLAWVRLPNSGVDEILTECERQGLPVVLAFWRGDRNGIEKHITQAIEHHRKNVIAIAWDNPYYGGEYGVDAVSQFGGWVKNLYPGMEFWQMEVSDGKYSTLPVPEEVDVIVPTLYGIDSPMRAQDKIMADIPNWLRLAKGRPILLCWTYYGGDNAGGLVPNLQPDTLRTFMELSRDMNLAGVLLDSYVDGFSSKGVRWNGLKTRQSLLQEVKEFSYRQGIGTKQGS